MYYLCLLLSCANLLLSCATAMGHREKAEVIERRNRNNANLEKRSTKVSEVFLEPKSVEAVVGSSFELTCRAVEHASRYERFIWLRWIEKINKTHPIKDRITHNSSNHIIKKSEHSTGSWYSVLTATYYVPWNGTIQCKIDASTRSKPKASANITITFAKKKPIVEMSASIASLLFLMLAAGLLYMLRRKTLKHRIQKNMLHMRINQVTNAFDNDDENNYHQVDTSKKFSSIDDFLQQMTTRYSPWQRNRRELNLKHVLGEGNFGSVIYGCLTIDEAEHDVAVKTIKSDHFDSETLLEFEKEISVMTTLQHDKIVNLVGLCTETLPLYIIMEYMVNGQLNQFLMKHKSDMDSVPMPSKLEAKDLLYMSVQPCKAIEYLSSKNIVHRDISARNCLVGENLIVKLADFGLSRGTKADTGKDYYKKDGGMVPIKWMSPEALTFGKYTTANDVWAFGVLMWEIFSFGAVPYHWLSNQEVICYVTRGGRLTKPEMCTTEVWKSILLTWAGKPDERVTIEDLSLQLQRQLSIVTGDVV